MLEKTSGKPRRGSKTKTRVRVVEDGRVRVRPDVLATEEPMEIRLLAGHTMQTVAVTMRTPGADFELAAGFLYGEGILDSPDDVQKISYCVDSDLDAEQRYNIVNVELRGGRQFDLRPLERHFYTTSACGVCGKASLEQLELRGCPVMPAGPEIPAETIDTLPWGGTTRRTSSSGGRCWKGGCRSPITSSWSADAAASRSCRSA
jgi:FdhD protein